MILLLLLRLLRSALIPILVVLVLAGFWASQASNKAFMINALGIVFVIVMILIVKPRPE